MVPFVLDRLSKAVQDHFEEEFRNTRIVNTFEGTATGPKLADKFARFAYKDGDEGKVGFELGSAGGKYVGASSKEHAGDDTYVEFLPLQGKGKLYSVLWDPNKNQLEVNPLELDGDWSLMRHTWTWFRSETEFEAVVFASPPFVARLTDPTMHGPFGPGLGSPNVLVGGKPALRVGVDMHVCPHIDPAPHIGGAVAKGASTVLVNGMPAVRAGDVIVEPGGGPNPIVAGCFTVSAGAAAPPVEAFKPLPRDPGFIEFEMKVVSDAGYAKVNNKAGGKFGAQGGDVRFKAEGRASALRVNPQGKLMVRIPGSANRVGFDFNVGGHFLSAGGEFEPTLGDSAPRGKTKDNVKGGLFGLDVEVNPRFERGEEVWP